MRLLNIRTGFLETVNLKYVKDKYIAISHRWLKNEIELLELGLVGIGKDINIGEKLYYHLNSKIKCSPIVKNIQTPKDINIESLKIYNHKNIQKNTKWNDYLNFFNNNKNIDYENINNHYKLIKIINCIIGDENYKKINYIWLDTICIDKSSSSELSENIISMYNIYKYAICVNVHLVNVEIDHLYIDALKEDQKEFLNTVKKNSEIDKIERETEKKIKELIDKELIDNRKKRDLIENNEIKKLKKIDINMREVLRRKQDIRRRLLREDRLEIKRTELMLSDEIDEINKEELKMKHGLKEYETIEENIKKNKEISKINEEIDKKNIININNILKDEWWSRVWTLQEYLANINLNFYDNKYNILFNKNDLNYICKFIRNKIEIPSYIDISYFSKEIICFPTNGEEKRKAIKYEDIDKSFKKGGIILNWIKRRISTRDEDIAYSLMGLLNIYVPPLYGEGGDNAMARIIKEYTNNTNDLSMFNIDILDFRIDINNIKQGVKYNDRYMNYFLKTKLNLEYTWTNMGLNINVNLIPLTIIRDKNKLENIRYILPDIKDIIKCEDLILFSRKEVNTKDFYIIILDYNNKILIRRKRNKLFEYIDKVVDHFDIYNSENYNYNYKKYKKEYLVEYVKYQLVKDENIKYENDTEYIKYIENISKNNIKNINIENIIDVFLETFRKNQEIKN